MVPMAWSCSVRESAVCAWARRWAFFELPAARFDCFPPSTIAPADRFAPRTVASASPSVCPAAAAPIWAAALAVAFSWCLPEIRSLEKLAPVRSCRKMSSMLLRTGRRSSGSGSGSVQAWPTVRLFSTTKHEVPALLLCTIHLQG